MANFNTVSFKFLDFKDMDSEMSKQVWECRNLPEIRKWMVNAEPIAIEEHIKFIKNIRTLTNTFYYCVLFNGIFVGSVNLHLQTQDKAERGIYIHPDFWGQRLSTRICSELYTHIRDNWGIKFITTKVLKNNRASNALEHSLGAVRTAEDRCFYYYLCDIS